MKNKKNKKRKLKRTPQQLHKIRKKQNERMMENRMKKVIETENRIKRQNEKVMEIKKQLTEEDWNDMWFHLTLKHRWDIIKNEGLKGGVGAKWGDDKGFLYLVDSDCKKLWNGIGSYHIINFDTKGTEDEKLKVRLGDIDYVVIGVPKRVFELMGCSLKEDMGMDITNYNQNHRCVGLGDKVIPTSLFKKVYEDRTDTHRYETVDRWDFYQKFYQRIGKDIPKEQLSINDEVLGMIRYEDRFEKTTNNFLKLSIEDKRKYQYSVRLKQYLRSGSSEMFKCSPQQNTNSPFVTKVRNSYEEEGVSNVVS